MFRAILLSSIVVNAGILLGRLAGFAREALIAKNFGVSSEADVVILLLTVPDILVNLLVGSALTAALIPEFLAKPDQSRNIWGQVLLVAGLFFSLFSLALAVHPDVLLHFFAPGLSGESVQAAAPYMAGVIWLIPLTVLSGVTMAYLQSENRFFASSMGTPLINVCILAGLWWGAQSVAPLFWIVVSVLCGGSLRFLMQYYSASLVRGGAKFSVRNRYVELPLLKRYGEVVLAGGILLCFPVIARAMASSLGEGQLALLSYALKLVELPQVLLIGVLVVVLYPRLSSAFQTNENQFRSLSLLGAEATVFVGLMSSVGMKFLAPAFTPWIYGFGLMTEADVLKIAELVALCSLGVVFVGMCTYAVSVLNAKGQTRKPLVINILGLIGFVGWLAWASWSSVQGIVIALVIVYALMALALVAVTFEQFALSDLRGRTGRYLLIILVPAIWSGSIYVATKLIDSSLFLVFTALAVGFLITVIGLFLDSQCRRFFFNLKRY